MLKAISYLTWFLSTVANSDAQRLLNLIEAEDKTSIIIDICCGVGTNSLAFLRTKKTAGYVIGIDHEKINLKDCRSNAQGLRLGGATDWILADVEQLPRLFRDKVVIDGIFTSPPWGRAYDRRKGRTLNSSPGVDISSLDEALNLRKGSTLPQCLKQFNVRHKVQAQGVYLPSVIMKRALKQFSSNQLKYDSCILHMNTVHLLSGKVITPLATTAHDQWPICNLSNWAVKKGEKRIKRLQPRSASIKSPSANTRAIASTLFSSNIPVEVGIQFQKGSKHELADLILQMRSKDVNDINISHVPVLWWFREFTRKYNK